ncbi:unnamed protein product [Rhizopus stolonifer]
MYKKVVPIRRITSSLSSVLDLVDNTSGSQKALFNDTQWEELQKQFWLFEFSMDTINENSHMFGDNQRMIDIMEYDYLDIFWIPLIQKIIRPINNRLIAKKMPINLDS